VTSSARMGRGETINSCGQIRDNPNNMPAIAKCKTTDSTNPFQGRRESTSTSVQGLFDLEEVVERGDAARSMRFRKNTRYAGSHSSNNLISARTLRFGSEAGFSFGILDAEPTEPANCSRILRCSSVNFRRCAKTLLKFHKFLVAPSALPRLRGSQLRGRSQIDAGRRRCHCKEEKFRNPNTV
jgi:hypothetical protein